MKKKPKIIMIVSLSLASAIVTYFSLGIIATYVVNEKLINVRGADINQLETSDYYQIQYTRKDYLLMQDREEIDFKCGKTNLKGYLYTVDNPVGVVIAAHGVTTYADGNHAQYHNFFLEHNWDVFSFDMTGCGRSSGKGMKTLHESRYCVSNAIKTVQNMDLTKDLPICLFGHSWGAYGVVSATEKHPDVKAVASFSGYNSAAEIMYGFAENYASKAVVLTKPAFETAVFILQGTDAFYEATSAIKKNKDTNYIVIQGDIDYTVPLEKYSLYSKVVDKNYSNVTPILLEGYGHNSPWKTLTANKYMEDVVEPALQGLHDTYGEHIPEDVFDQFLLTIDKEKANGLNYFLLEQINSIFLESI